MNNIIQVPISVGELCDKYTILQIKGEKITDKHKLVNIEKELRYLESIVTELNITSNKIMSLKLVNEKLWNIEDNIRIKEYNKEFDAEFIQLARSVYVTNDLRFEIKNNISKEYNSDIFEVKSYNKY
jgi:hypothetical protein|tara:strand:- start:73 stop:453 length:381 start_codon:yes stop_codon:yes gene_type:complete